MKLLDINKVPVLPDDMDQECIDLCNFLNTLPGVETMESCCCHLEYRYSIWFHCTNIDTLSRLGRATERNYSDGKWEVVVDSCDTSPYGLFWLRSMEPFDTTREMMKSVDDLIENIQYWFKDEFDNHFIGQQSLDSNKPKWISVKDLPDHEVSILAASRNNDWPDGIWIYEFCNWNGKEFEGRTRTEKIVKWIPQYDIDNVLMTE
jgi:hypothetical protein